MTSLPTNKSPTPTTAPTPLSSDSKSLDTLRRSLLSLTHTLQALHRDLAGPPGTAPHLPPWSSLQNSFNLLTHNLTALSTHIDASRALLQSAHAYPLPSFPGRQHEPLLAQLLLKKQDPAEPAPSVDADAVAAPWRAELWDWALPCAGDAAARVPFGIDVSVAERGAEGGAEAVRAREGIARVLRVRSDVEEEEAAAADEEENDAQEGERGAGKMDVDVDRSAAAAAAAVGKAAEVLMVPLEEVLKFMTTGAERTV